MTTTPHTPAPYCSACGYELSGAIDSSRCPECGRPLVEVLVRDEGAQRVRRRHESDATFLGKPLVSIAIGPGPDGTPGHARGWFAYGDLASGAIAMGGRAFGIVAIGGFATGVMACGGVAIGLLAAGGGLALAGGFALGGMAAGGVSLGGVAFGFVALGGVSVGMHGLGGMVVGNRGLPAHVNMKTLAASMVALNIGVVMIASLPAIVGAVLMRRGGRRDRE